MTLILIIKWSFIFNLRYIRYLIIILYFIFIINKYIKYLYQFEKIKYF